MVRIYSKKNEKQKKYTDRHFSAFALILFFSIISFFSVTQCIIEAKKETNAYSILKDKNQVPLKSINLTKDQFYAYSLNQCIAKDHFFEGAAVKFSISFFLETLLLFLFLGFISKGDKVMSLLKSAILAILGISTFYLVFLKKHCYETMERSV